jgi:hypothetical protein
VILCSGLGAERLKVVVGGHLRGAGCEGYAGAGEDVEAEVAAAFGPFVVLLGQDGADEPDQGVTAGEDPDDVGPPAYFPVEPFLRVVAPDLSPEFLGEAGEGQDIGPGGVQVRGDLGQLAGDGVDQPVVLGMDRRGVGLVIDRVQQRLDPMPLS